MSNNNIDFDGSSESSGVTFLSKSEDEKQVVGENEKKSDQMSDEESAQDPKIPQKQRREYLRRTNQRGGKSLSATQKHQKRKAVHSQEKTQKKQNQSQVFFLYKPGAQLPDLSEYLNQYIELRIAKDYLTKYNKQLIHRNLWGTETYTSNSDPIAMMIHHGLINLSQENIQKYEGVSFFVKVTKTRKNYTTTNKNGIISRAKKGYKGYSLKPDKVCWMTSLGKIEDLTKFAKKMAQSHQSKKIKCNDFMNVKPIIPIPEVNIVFNMCNEPAYKYSCINICDKSNDSKTWTSYKLKSQVLYIETNGERYEVSRQVDQEDIFNEYDLYRFAKVADPLNLDNEIMNQINRPLSSEYLDKQCIFSDLDWNQILWGTETILVKDYKIEKVKNYKFYTRSDIEQK